MTSFGTWSARATVLNMATVLNCKCTIRHGSDGPVKFLFWVYFTQLLLATAQDTQGSHAGRASCSETSALSTGQDIGEGHRRWDKVVRCLLPECSAERSPVTRHMCKLDLCGSYIYVLACFTKSGTLNPILHCIVLGTYLLASTGATEPKLDERHQKDQNKLRSGGGNSLEVCSRQKSKRIRMALGKLYLI